MSCAAEARTRARPEVVMRSGLPTIAYVRSRPWNDFASEPETTRGDAASTDLT